jgi:hypothetical protein
MGDQIFIIDANTLIAPYRIYYPFDIAPSFWEQMKGKILDGSVVILDMVHDEIMAGNDELTNWMSSMQIDREIIDHRDSRILAGYSSVLQYIQTSGLYLPKALTEWSLETVADPWLIAAAAANHYTLVTLEKSSGQVSRKNPNSKAKIPDIASHFGVSVCSLYDMMRILKFHL